MCSVTIRSNTRSFSDLRLRDAFRKIREGDGCYERRPNPVGRMHDNVLLRENFVSVSDCVQSVNLTVVDGYLCLCSLSDQRPDKRSII